MTNLFFNPVKVISGRGCVGSFDWRSLGKKCMVVCGERSARLSGALDDLKTALSAAGIAVAVFDKVEQNPSVETCFAAGAAAREFKADFIVGIGGGSPLDAAKAAAYFAANAHLNVDTLYDGECKSSPLPVVAIPTTAGTGSEVTQYAVLTYHKIQNKKTLKTPSIFPVAALLDAEYTVTLPQSVTNATAVDALCHAIEGYLSKSATPVSDALAEKAIFLTVEFVPVMLRPSRRCFASISSDFVRFLCSPPESSISSRSCCHSGSSVVICQMEE